ncbi:hypothetical protein [Belnapia moabensis]|uniref:hypothetical protein n=1 Tax=Belnapia moabensis TaxID=365533 RepID=UPI0012EE2D34
MEKAAGLGGSDERLGMVIVSDEVAMDSDLQSRDALAYAAPDALTVIDAALIVLI